MSHSRKIGCAVVLLVALVALTCSCRGALAGEPAARIAGIPEVVKSGDFAKVQAWLETNSGLASVKDTNGSTALHVAANAGHQDVAELLLAHKADVNATDDLGNVPLHYAAAGGFKAVVALLLASNANVNVRNNDGATPLLAAAHENRRDAAALLLAHQADVNAAGKNGVTALHLAAEFGYTEVVELLLTNNANINVNAKDIGGYTPLSLATAKSHKDLVEMLRAHGAH